MALSANQHKDYVPSTDAGVRDWLNTFAARVALSPAAYGLTPADSAMLTALAAAYDQAYVVAADPATRTRLAVSARRAARKEALAAFRAYAMRIKANLGVTDEQRLAIGLHVDDLTPTPVPPPSTFPLLTIRGGDNGRHVLRFADCLTPASRARPAGAASLQLVRTIGEEPGLDLPRAQLVGVYTRQPIRAATDPALAGRSATYAARWANAKGEPGPWGPAAAMTIVFGGPVKAAA